MSRFLSLLSRTSKRVSKQASIRPQSILAKAVRPVVETLERRLFFSIGYSVENFLTPISNIESSQKSSAGTMFFSADPPQAYDGIWYIGGVDSFSPGDAEVDVKSNIPPFQEFSFTILDSHISGQAHMVGFQSGKVEATFTFDGTNTGVLSGGSGKTIKFNFMSDACFSSNPVRYADGGAKLHFDDFGGLLDNSMIDSRRSWSNLSYSGDQLGAKISGFGLGGNPWIDVIWEDYYGHNGVSHKFQFLGIIWDSTNADIMLVANGQSSSMRRSPTGGELRIEVDVANDSYRAWDGEGNEWVFADFSNNWEARQKGSLLSRTSAGGVKYEVTGWTDYDLPEAYRVTYPAVNGNSAQVDELTYSYDGTSDRVTQVQLSRGTLGNLSPIRTVQYAYYGSSEDHGDSGDLKHVTIRDGDEYAAIHDQQYYRWYKDEDPKGYDGGLKLWLGGDAYRKATAALASQLDTVETAADFDDGGDLGLVNFADNYFEYDDEKRVVKELAQGEGCSCAGVEGQGEFTFEYADENTEIASGGLNTWQYKTIERLPDHTPGNANDNDQNIVYTNQWGLPVLKIFQDTSENEQYITYYRYDAQGQVTLVANPSAVSGFDEDLNDLVGYDADTGEATYLRDDAGLIEITEYYDASTAPVPELVGYKHAKYVQQGDDVGTRQKQAEWTYVEGGAGDGVFFIASETLYAGVGATDAEVTSYAYTWHVDGSSNPLNQMKTRTTTHAVISAGQNGPNSSDTEVEYFDTRGNVIWTVDGDGYINFYRRDGATGAVIEQIVDANPGSIANPAVAGPTRSVGLPTALAITTTFTVDQFGRETKRTDPKGNITYTVYDDTTDDGDPIEVRVYAGWNAGTKQPTGPVTVWRSYPEYQYTETLSYSFTDMAGLPVDGSGVPTGAEDLNDPDTTIHSLTRSYENISGQVTRTNAYHDLDGLSYVDDATEIGTLNTDYIQTQTGYDERGRVNRSVDGTGTITRYVRDGRGNILSIWVGTDDEPSTGFWSPTNTTGTNLVKVSESDYDEDGNLIQATAYPDSVTSRVTQYWYDDRNRLVATRSGTGTTDDNTHPVTVYTYDNLDQVTRIDQYDGDSITDPLSPDSGKLRARTDYAYDDQGRVYRTSVYTVDPSNGTVGTALVTNTWYDHRGNVIKSQTPGGLVTKTTYDGASRVDTVFNTDGGSDTTWAHADDVDDDIVLQQAEYDYDANGNVILTTTRQRFHDASGTGALGNPSSTSPVDKARVSYSASYYDAIDRLVADVNVGTNGGSSYSRLGSAPGRSDTVLVNSYTYDAAGNLATSTDPKAIETRYAYDDLGRKVIVIEAYTDGTPSNADDRITRYTYDGNGNIVTLTADLPSPQVDQTTQYIYGVTTGTGSEINSNNLLSAVRYPDKTTGVASENEEERFTYNALGQITTKTDRMGNEHEYTYDTLGRLTEDYGWTVGGVDNSVVRLAFTYNTQGLPEKFTSYEDNDRNEVMRVYNGLGQLVTEYQAHDGAVNVSTTPKVQYTYDTPANGARPTSMVYPNGRTISYAYNSGIDANISRLSALKESSLVHEGYSYLGLNTVVKLDRGENLDLTYIAGSAGDAGDQYAGLDRFGRIVDQRWAEGTTDVDRISYAYDRNSNRTIADNMVASPMEFDEYYFYDKLNRLTFIERLPELIQGFSLDAVGNMNIVTTDDGSINPISQYRTHNAQNQITTVDSAELEYDANGNIQIDENGREYRYDAWNRMMSVRDGLVDLGEYEYDALGRRIEENGNDLFYSGQWQVLEERDSGGDTTTQYLWSPTYMDAMIARDRDADGNPGTGANGLEERWYVQYDANYNITSISDDDGEAIERYTYDPYGKRTSIRDQNWALDGDGISDWDFNHGHQGGKLDPATGLMHFRNREYSTSLMRWMQQDPLGYVDGMNVYGALANNPIAVLDPSGTINEYVTQIWDDTNGRWVDLWMTPDGRPSVTSMYDPYAGMASDLATLGQGFANFAQSIQNTIFGMYNLSVALNPGAYVAEKISGRSRFISSPQWSEGICANEYGHHDFNMKMMDFSLALLSTAASLARAEAAMRAAGEAARASQAALATQSSVTGYRAVSQAEWDYISRYGELYSPPGTSTPSGTTGKWFYDNLESAKQFGNAMSRAEGTPYGIVQVQQIPRSSISHMQSGLDQIYGVTNGNGLFAEFPGISGLPIFPVVLP